MKLIANNTNNITLKTIDQKRNTGGYALSSNTLIFERKKHLVHTEYKFYGTEGKKAYILLHTFSL